MHTKITFAKSTLHGIGIFATTNIAKGNVIEVCPIILLNFDDTKKIDRTYLYNYYFSWQKRQSAFALGYGSLYNHSYSPNAQYTKNFSHDTITFTSIRSIKKGEEITVNYNGNPHSKNVVWFEKKIYDHPSQKPKDTILFFQDHQM